MNIRRTIPLAALAITTGAVLYATVMAAGAEQPAAGWLFQSLIHVGELLALVALALSGAVGRVIPGRVALAVAMLGQACLVVAELLWSAFTGVADVLFAAGPVLGGGGLVVAGVAVARAGHWRGWRRFAPLATGAYVFVVLTPAMVVSGGPPAPVAILAIAGWDVLWTLVGVAALARVEDRHARVEARHARVTA